MIFNEIKNKKNIVDIENIVDLRKNGMKNILNQPSYKNRDALILQTISMKTEFFLDFLCVLK
jgi:hypothetical protein